MISHLVPLVPVAMYNICHGIFNIPWSREILKLVPVLSLMILNIGDRTVKSLIMYALGDLFLLSDNKPFLLAGMTSFFIGHLYEILLTLNNPGFIKSDTLEVFQHLFILANLYVYFLSKYTKQFTLPVLIYSYVLALKISIGLLSDNIIPDILFGVSDSLLGIEIFVQPNIMKSRMIKTMILNIYWAGLYLK